MNKELFKYYSLSECVNTGILFNKLDKLNDAGKIQYTHDLDKLVIEDIELTENEISSLILFFEKNDILIDLDIEDDNEDDDYSDFQIDYEI